MESHEDGNEALGSIKRGEFLDHVSHHKLLNNYSALYYTISYVLKANYNFNRTDIMGEVFHVIRIYNDNGHRNLIRNIIILICILSTFYI